MLLMLDLGQLKAFVEVAERGTVSHAAAALSYSGPAVSQQISRLEKELGMALFDRVGGRLRLNGHGERLLQHAHRLLDLDEEARRDVTAVEPPAHTVIAGFASALRSLVVPLVGAGAFAGTVEVLEAEDDAALRELRLGHVDIAIIQDYDGLPTTKDDRLHVTQLVRDRLRLVTGAHHDARVTLTDLQGSGWLVNGDGTRCEQATEAVLARAGITPTITGRISDNHTLLTLVAAGQGSTIVPELMLAHSPTDVTVSSQDLRARRTILAVVRAAGADRHRALVRTLASHARAAVASVRSVR